VGAEEMMMMMMMQPFPKNTIINPTTRKQKHPQKTST
jgi:hypothetical protein